MSMHHREDPQDVGKGSGHGTLRGVDTPLSSAEVLDRLDRLAKRGKLAGFRRGDNGVLFRAEAHGLTFDFDLLARGSAADTTALRFDLRIVPLTPLIAVVSVLLAAGPGLWLTHSMLETYFSWYRWSMGVTAAWYIPLTVLPAPLLLLRSLRHSREAAHKHAVETIERIAAEVDGRVV